VEVQILGQVRAWRGHTELDLGGRGQRALLALLATTPEQVVTGPELVDALWATPPSSAVNIIQTYVKRLRRILEPDRRPRTPSTVLPSVGVGYALQVPAEGLDVSRFRELLRSATRAQQDRDQHLAARLLAAAVGLWHGAPLADLAFLADHPRVVALAIERWAATARYGELMIAIGAAADALPALYQAAAAQPLDEIAQTRLIRAYRAAGKRDQAFTIYHTIRRRLAEELGVDPGPELVEAHAALLAQDLTPASADLPAAQSHPPAAPTVPCQLPAHSTSFTGRADQLRQLDQLRATTPQAATVVISAIAGAAGIGKTTLAVHWAHQIAEKFPDGQLFVNLHGFDPTGAAMSPAEAIRTLLAALQVPPRHIPATLDAQVGLYRSLLAGRRMLIVLDNARDPEQVRPLLPGVPGCLVLVTSRDQLTGLVAADGAHPLTLDLLPDTEARELIRRQIGTDRATAEPDAVGEIVNRCAGLPLALALVAARAAVRPEHRLDTVAHELREGLGAFSTGDVTTDIRAVFSWSYQALSADAQRLFRLLALHPGPDLAAPAAASLAGIPVTRARPLLAELARAHLVTEEAPGRYAFHDLLHTYAAELLGTLDDETERRAARHRVLDHYLHTADSASRLLEPDRDSIAGDSPEPGTTAEHLTDYRQALAWFMTEHRVLLAATRQAADAGSGNHAWRLAWTLAGFLDLRGHWHDQIAVQTAGWHAAIRVNHRRAQISAHNGLGRAYARLGRFGDAHAQLRHAVALSDELGDHLVQGHARGNVGRLLTRQHRYQEAMAHYEQALELYRAAGGLDGEMRMLNSIGWQYVQLGDYRRAIVYCEQSLALARESGNRHLQGIVWDSVGFAQHHLGNHQQAAGCYERALALHRESGERYYEAEVLAHQGDNHYAIGDLDAADGAWQQALAILEELGHPDADDVRRKLKAPAAS
jgi:DNA-binding SARP family transcriptional activator/Tfp pilus assembly protein PilF